MKIDLTSMMFNMTTTEGGNPSWGTSLGQGADHKIEYLGSNDIIIGMVYKKIDINDVFCPLGKGSKKQGDYEMVLAGVFDKIYANNIFIPNARFILLIVKQLVSSPDSSQHVGRLTLKYNIKMTYKNEGINEACFNEIVKNLDLNESSAWFVSDINVLNQDELHFSIKIADANGPKNFKNSKERKNFCQSLINKDKVNNGLNKYIYGAPGSGKSFYFQKCLKSLNVDDSNIFRTVFHSEYTNSDFIGQILPTIEKKKDSEGNITEVVKYIFNPGPFTKALLKSYQTNEMVYLII